MCVGWLVGVLVLLWGSMVSFFSFFFFSCFGVGFGVRNGNTGGLKETVAGFAAG